jgi:cation diffusion facilitator CzcD-associated flavoprotein CzcO
MNHTRTAIIGAGPFGLALAARLRTAGSDFTLFGRPMSFWREHVLAGTRLLTYMQSCSFAPEGSGLNCGEYAREAGMAVARRIGADEFIDYGLWFQRNARLDADERDVAHIELDGGSFKIRLSNGGMVMADHVVLAIGLRVFANRPREFAAVSRHLVPHSSDVTDPRCFRGKQVAIIGRGQSALDCAALLLEAGAEVEVIARNGAADWTWGTNQYPVPAPLRDLDWRTRVIRAGGATLRHPDVFRRLPAAFRDYWLKRFLVPKPSVELAPRLTKAKLTVGRGVTAAEERGNRIEIGLDDGSSRVLDHVVLGTGYGIDVDAIDFLDADLRARIARHDGYPVLNGRMQSSVRGLYFAGATAAWNFGPLMWFVRGAPWSAQRIATALAPGRLRPTSTAH